MKKVLLITYYWPPCGGIGVLRCLKFAKYLREFGWEPIIFTADNAHYPSIDYSNEKDIPENLTVLRQRIWEPYHLYKFITGQDKAANVNNVFYVKDRDLGWQHKLSVWIRSNFFIPDARAWWIRPSVKFLTNYLKENPVDAILSDGPPHSNTRIATLVKQKTNIPWLADFQDPWTQIDYYQLLSLTKWGDRKHKRLEQAAFRAADKITIASPTWAKELEDIGAKDVSWLPWGYDPEDYEQIKIEVDTKFSFTHLGILGYDRHPKGFFVALQQLLEELPTLKNDLHIQLVGQVDYSVREAYTELGLEQQVQEVGSVPRSEALRLTMSSQVLLLLLNQQSNAKGRIPGKLFEYLAARRPILCLGGTNSDVAQILHDSRSGSTCEYKDVDGIKEAIRQLYKDYQVGQLQQPVDSEIEQYSVRKLTGQLAEWLEKMTA
jgi:glycosyltransferase involved in cell wall biosynthesis